MKRADRLAREIPRPCVVCQTPIVDMRKWPICEPCTRAIENTAEATPKCRQPAALAKLTPRPCHYCRDPIRVPGKVPMCAACVRRWTRSTDDDGGELVTA